MKNANTAKIFNVKKLKSQRKSSKSGKYLHPSTLLKIRTKLTIKSNIKIQKNFVYNVASTFLMK
jgi:hypothetical protein